MRLEHGQTSGSEMYYYYNRLAIHSVKSVEKGYQTIPFVLPLPFQHWPHFISPFVKCNIKSRLNITIHTLQ